MESFSYKKFKSRWVLFCLFHTPLYFHAYVQNLDISSKSKPICRLKLTTRHEQLQWGEESLCTSGNINDLKLWKLHWPRAPPLPLPGAMQRSQLIGRNSDRASLEMGFFLSSLKGWSQGTCTSAPGSLAGTPSVLGFSCCSALLPAS